MGDKDKKEKKDKSDKKEKDKSDKKEKSDKKDKKDKKNKDSSHSPESSRLGGGAASSDGGSSLHAPTAGSSAQYAPSSATTARDGTTISATTTAAASSAPPQPPAQPQLVVTDEMIELEYQKARLRRYYSIRCPDKVGDTEKNVMKYHTQKELGGFDKMWKGLEKKYKAFTPQEDAQVPTKTQVGNAMRKQAATVNAAAASKAASSVSAGSSHLTADQPESDRARLLRFYLYYAPHKVGDVETLLVQHNGRYDAMWREMTEKYGPEPKKPPMTGGQDLGKVDPKVERESWRSRMRAYYAHYKIRPRTDSSPDQDIEESLTLCQGNSQLYQQMWTKLLAKHGPEPVAPTSGLMSRYLDTTTEDDHRTQTTNTTRSGYGGGGGSSTKSIDPLSPEHDFFKTPGQQEKHQGGSHVKHLVEGREYSTDTLDALSPLSAETPGPNNQPVPSASPARNHNNNTRGSGAHDDLDDMIDASLPVPANMTNTITVGALLRLMGCTVQVYEKAEDEERLQFKKAIEKQVASNLKIHRYQVRVTKILAGIVVEMELELPHDDMERGVADQLVSKILLGTFTVPFIREAYKTMGGNPTQLHAEGAALFGGSVSEQFKQHKHGASGDRSPQILDELDSFPGGAPQLKQWPWSNPGSPGGTTAASQSQSPSPKRGGAVAGGTEATDKINMIREHQELRHKVMGISNGARAASQDFERKGGGAGPFAPKSQARRVESPTRYQSAEEVYDLTGEATAARKAKEADPYDGWGSYGHTTSAGGINQRDTKLISPMRLWTSPGREGSHHASGKQSSQQQISNADPYSKMRENQKNRPSRREDKPEQQSRANIGHANTDGMKSMHSYGTMAEHLAATDGSPPRHPHKGKDPSSNPNLGLGQTDLATLDAFGRASETVRSPISQKLQKNFFGRLWESPTIGGANRNQDSAFYDGDAAAPQRPTVGTLITRDSALDEVHITESGNRRLPYATEDSLENDNVIPPQSVQSRMFRETHKPQYLNATPSTDQGVTFGRTAPPTFARFRSTQVESVAGNVAKKHRDDGGSYEKEIHMEQLLGAIASPQEYLKHGRSKPLGLSAPPGATMAQSPLVAPSSQPHSASMLMQPGAGSHGVTYRPNSQFRDAPTPNDAGSTTASYVPTQGQAAVGITSRGKITNNPHLITPSGSIYKGANPQGTYSQGSGYSESNAIPQAPIPKEQTRHYHHGQQNRRPASPPRQGQNQVQVPNKPDYLFDIVDALSA